jgi:hypothetical protein
MGNDMNEEQEPEDFAWQVEGLDFSDLDEQLQPLRDLSYRRIAHKVVDQIFLGSVGRGQVLDLTGEGPFGETDLIELGLMMGVFSGYLIDSIEDASDELDAFGFLIVVVGRVDFATGFLDWVLDQLATRPGSIRVLSQEDFLNYWLFGEYERYTREDPRVWDHPALTYLAENSGPRWPWPSTDTVPSLGGDLSTEGWTNEHPLKGRFGYTVNARVGLTDAERHRILDHALTTADDPLNLYDVAHHIGWLIRSNRKAQRFKVAITKWERDLDYLKVTYYQNNFFWPTTD